MRENAAEGKYREKSVKSPKSARPARLARWVKMGGQREMDGDTADELLGTCGVSI
jgi:hypothetical protein